MKFLKVLCAVALVLAVSTIAYAETQSVKISGEITERAFARDNFDLDNNNTVTTNTGYGSSDWATYLLSTVEVQVDADLTDNVAAVIRLENQRVWGDQYYLSDNNGELGRIAGIRDQVVARDVNWWGSLLNESNAYKIGVDLAYIELKEFLYSPLTLRIGRQDLWFGKGFIIGNSLLDSENNIYPQEYTCVTSFDAVRATLDYDPWTIDGVFAKMSENARRSDDDINLWGINVGYVFDSYNAEVEGYWWYRQHRNPDTAATIMSITANNNLTSNDVHTFGARGSFDPIEDWTIALEGAYQAGDFIGIAAQREERKRSAWAIDAMVECRYWQDDFAWRPVLGAEYIYYSGEKDSGDRNVTSNGTYNGWDPMYRGKFDTAIREFQNVFYRTTQVSTPSFTNQHQLLVRGSVEPTDSLTVNATYAHFWLDKQYNEDNTRKNVGDEVDVTVTWDYTEDVSFGLLAGWFFPGNYWRGGEDNIATDVVGTVKLSF
ncbi:MAG: alginate export family protein [Candidatus Omnitrophota bacterium]